MCATRAENFYDLEACGEGQKRDVARLLDGHAQLALVRGADAGETARHDLAALGYEALQQTDVAIRDRVDLLRAELADLLAAEELAAAGAAPRTTACGTRTTRAAGTGGRTAAGTLGALGEGLRSARSGRSVNAAGAAADVAGVLVSSAMMFPLCVSFCGQRPRAALSSLNIVRLIHDRGVCCGCVSVPSSQGALEIFRRRLPRPELPLQARHRRTTA